MNTLESVVLDEPDLKIKKCISLFEMHHTPLRGVYPVENYFLLSILNGEYAVAYKYGNLKKSVLPVFFKKNNVMTFHKFDDALNFYVNQYEIHINRPLINLRIDKFLSYFQKIKSQSDQKN
jgi:hypothetical protein